MRTTSLTVIFVAGCLLGGAGCKRKPTTTREVAAKRVAMARPAPMDWSEPRPAIRRPTPPQTADAGAPKPKGLAPRWTWLPSNKYLCTRHGPEWKAVPGKKGKYTYDKPFVLTFPQGKLIKLNMHAKGRDRSGVTYEATGLPQGATLDAKRGRLKWRVAGKPGDQHQIKLVAKSGKGARAEWELVLGVAAEDFAAAWKAGLGNEQRDCTDQYRDLTLTLQDVNGDGNKDVLWTYIQLDDGQPVDAYTHAVMLYDNGTYYAALEGIQLAGTRSHLNVVCAPGGVKLLQLVDNCCAGETHQLYRVKGHKAVDVGDVYLEDTTVGNPSIRYTHDTNGCITKITTRERGKTTVYRWKNGKFR